MALHVDVYRVEHGAGFSMPRIALANRRAAGAPTLHWICQRHLEILLYNRVDGGSSGAIWKALSQSGLGGTSLCCSKKAVNDGLLLADEFAQIMTVFKNAIPADATDPSSLGRSAPPKRGRSPPPNRHPSATLAFCSLVSKALRSQLYPLPLPSHSGVDLRMLASTQFASARSCLSRPPPSSVDNMVARGPRWHGCAPLGRCALTTRVPKSAPRASLHESSLLVLVCVRV